jgi:hypothetical protein
VIVVLGMTDPVCLEERVLRKSFALATAATTMLSPRQKIKSGGTAP